MRQIRCSLMTLAAVLFLDGLQAAETNVPSPLRLNSPSDYQVHQRVDRDGKIVVAGSMPGASEQRGRLEARLIGKGAPAGWRKLANAEPGQREFRAELKAPAGGWYRLEVRVRQGKIIAAASVEHVGVG